MRRQFVFVPASNSRGRLVFRGISVFLWNRINRAKRQHWSCCISRLKSVTNAPGFSSGSGKDHNTRTASRCHLFIIDTRLRGVAGNCLPTVIATNDGWLGGFLRSLIGRLQQQGPKPHRRFASLQFQSSLAYLQGLKKIGPTVNTVTRFPFLSGCWKVRVALVKHRSSMCAVQESFGHPASDAS